MPCLEIGMPEADDTIRGELTVRLTDVFCETTSFGADIFGIRFHEYSYGHAASGGTLCDGSEARPYIHMLFYGPRIDRTTKARLVESWSRVFAEVWGKPAWTPVIHLCEHAYENVGVNGRLLADAYPELAGREFYYKL